MYLVSIIMPTYNAYKYIKQTIESVLNQTYENFELIIVDDNSIDNTYEYCLELKKKDKRIKVLKNTQKGVSSARNIGIDNANGKYIMFIDSDDVYDKCIIEKMIKNVYTSELVICKYDKKKNNIIKNTKIKYKDNDISTEDMIIFLQRNQLLNPVWNKIYIKEILVTNKIKFNTNISIAEDLEFNLNYINHIKNISFINESLYIYNINENGLNLSYHECRIDIRKMLYRYQKEMFIKKEYDVKKIFREYIKICLAELRQVNYAVSSIIRLTKDEERLKELKYIMKKGVFFQKIVAYSMYNKFSLVFIAFLMKILYK